MLYDDGAGRVGGSIKRTGEARLCVFCRIILALMHLPYAVAVVAENE